MKKYYTIKVIYELRANSYEDALKRLAGKTKDTQKIKTRSIEYLSAINK